MKTPDSFTDRYQSAASAGQGLITRTTLLQEKEKKNTAGPAMSGNPNPLIYSHHSLSVQLCASMHSIMIDTTLRRASGKSGIHGSVSGLYTPGALSCKWLLLYSKNPAFKNDSSWASEREGCILNISALQGHHPCFLSTTSKRHSSRASISIAEHCVLCL